MKFYSELTGELFNTVEELDKAEEKVLNEIAEKAVAETEIDAAFDEAINAWNNYLDVCKKYNHKSAPMPDNLFRDIINSFFK